MYTSDGGYAVLESRSGTPEIRKVDNAGSTEWVTYFSDASIWTPNDFDICPTSDGGFVISCRSNDADILLIWTDSNGDSLFSQAYGGENSDGPRSFIATGDGGYCVAGYQADDANDFDVFVVRIDETGYVLWTRIFGSTDFDESVYSIKEIESDGFILAGSIGTSLANHDYYLLRLSASGDSLWTYRLDWDFSTEAKSVEITNDNGYLVIGCDDGNEQNLMAVLFESDTEDYRGNDAMIPFRLSLGCYPNPFNPITTLSFDLTHPGMVKLKVFDVTGRRVATLIDGNMTTGQHEITFDGIGLASGIYFARMTAGSQTMTRKMVLLK